MGRHRESLLGVRSGRLTVIEDSARPYHWVCLCECGNITEVRAAAIKANRITSCGCQRIGRAGFLPTHDMSRTKIYYLWAHMISRCSNPNSDNYHNYGGRGITVCERWKTFENFFVDMGEPSKGLTLDRIDNEKGYSKDNCRWATQKEQCNNTRRNVFVDYKGETLTIAQLADRFGIKYITLYMRINRDGYSPYDAVMKG